MNSIKVVLFGDSMTGKTAYIKRHVSGKFEYDHTPTMTPNTSTFQIRTNYGVASFGVIDTPGDIAENNIESYKGINAFLIFYDSQNIQSYINAKGKWYELAKKIDSDIPIIFCYNKVDIKYRKVPYLHMRLLKQNMGVNCVDVSAKSCFNFDRPFIQILKDLTGIEDLKEDHGDIPSISDFKVNMEEIEYHENMLPCCREKSIEGVVVP